MVSRDVVIELICPPPVLAAFFLSYLRLGLEILRLTSRTPEMEGKDLAPLRSNSPQEAARYCTAGAVA